MIRRKSFMAFILFFTSMRYLFIEFIFNEAIYYFAALLFKPRFSLMKTRFQNFITTQVIIIVKYYYKTAIGNLFKKTFRKRE